MDELYYLLDVNQISMEEDAERDRAIRLLLKTKRRTATKIINDKYIIDVYRKKGMQGIKKLFNRQICYLYSTDFCYDVLFYHYKNDWRKLEIIIKGKIDGYKT
tara:strand:- start:194 stop:502 length:309 start_codon:yes stop_codon:yes gene_type:complete